MVSHILCEGVEEIIMATKKAAKKTTKKPVKGGGHTVPPKTGKNS